MNSISKEEVRLMVERFVTVREQVLEIYENNNGHPEKPETLQCPDCEEEALHYSCDWFGSKHVHIYCSNCEWTVME